ncbi:MAG: MBL fold metallo-hydrolase [Chloroflexi bacterium]|nr:MBL fold metallo-hydrolase [Chloroflexota bacterium]
MREPEIIITGRDSGEDMIVRYQTSKGTEIYGLAIPNVHDDTDWNLGPTWCYFVLGQKNILIDTGRFGNLEVLKNQLGKIGKRFSDIDIIIITHGHEDHDGNLPDVLPLTHAQLAAYHTYQQMISYFPEIEDGAPHPELPGSCRSCAMPDKFVLKNCINYHQKRSRLSIDFAIRDGETSPIDGLNFVFTPGHSADSMCVILDNEVIFTGDTILPDITPHPSRASNFESNRRILPEGYGEQNEVYGLMNYIKSLAKIDALDDGQFQATFTAHRLFYNGQFNLVHHPRYRSNEIIRFHIDRCRDVIRIISSEAKNLDQIADEHFTPSQLARHGRLMARNELLAHIEVMEEYGDVRWTGENEDILQHTGSYGCLDAIGAYLR